MATSGNSSSNNSSGYWVGSDSSSDLLSLRSRISETSNSSSNNISSSSGYWVGSDSSSDQLSLRSSLRSSMSKNNNCISNGSADAHQRQKAHIGCVKAHQESRGLIPDNHKSRLPDFNADGILDMSDEEEEDAPGRPPLPREISCMTPTQSLPPNQQIQIPTKQHTPPPTPIIAPPLTTKHTAPSSQIIAATPESNTDLGTILKAIITRKEETQKLLIHFGS